MKRLEHLFVLLNGWALIAMLGAMTLIVGANIGLRYLTGQSLSWADEAARYLMIWMTFSGAGLALRYGGHVAITNLQEQLPNRGQQVMRAVLAIWFMSASNMPSGCSFRSRLRCACRFFMSMPPCRWGSRS